MTQRKSAQKAQKDTTHHLKVFDVDGVLTDSKERMDDKFAMFFETFAMSNPTILVTGSPISQLKKQIPESILKCCMLYFGLLGNEYAGYFNPPYSNVLQYVHDTIHDKFKLDKDLEEELLSLSPDAVVVNRGPTVYYAICGASEEKRRAYVDSCDTVKDRIALIKSLEDRYPDLTFSVGGKVGIDIYPAGSGKEQIIDTAVKYFGKKIIFFGDKTMKYGNDYELYREVKKVGGLAYQVNGGWRETWMRLQNENHA